MKSGRPQYSAYFEPDRGSKYCDERMSVCLFLCPLAYLNKCSAAAETGDRLATIDMCRKVGGLLCPFRGEQGPHLTNVAWVEAYLRTKWHRHS